MHTQPGYTLEMSPRQHKQTAGAMGHYAYTVSVNTTRPQRVITTTHFRRMTLTVVNVTGRQYSRKYELVPRELM